MSDGAIVGGKVVCVASGNEQQARRLATLFLIIMKSYNLKTDATI